MTRRLLHFGCLTVVMLGYEVSGDLGGNGTILTRRKRNLVFPEGSVFSVVLCVTLATLNSADIFTEAVAWQIDYELFQEPEGDGARTLKAGPILRRRRRVDLYRKLEVAIGSIGVDGRACVLRALCEASQRLPTGGTVMQELLRVVFMLPLERVARKEPEEHHQYVTAHRSGFAGIDCGFLFPGCPVSLLDVALGLRAHTDSN